MNFKYVIGGAMLMMLTLSNYFLISEYMTEYVPENFDIKKLLDKKYRCIRYFDEKNYNKFTHNSCKALLHDYVDFKLEKSRYIYAYYAHNSIIISIIVVFMLLL